MLDRKCEINYFVNPEWLKKTDNGKYVLTDKAPPKAVESYQAFLKFYKEHGKEDATGLLAKFVPD